MASVNHCIIVNWSFYKKYLADYDYMEITLIVLKHSYDKKKQDNDVCSL